MSDLMRDIISFLDLHRAKFVYSDNEKISESEFVVLNEIREKKIDVDLVYFNTDEETNSSFPAVFLKKVSTFNDIETLKNIAETQKQIWNYKKILFLYVYSEIEIRIYNCAEIPLIVTTEDFDYQNELQKIEIKAYKYSDTQQLDELNKLFSRISIDTGIIWTSEEAKEIKDKINLQKRVDKYLVSSLVNTSKQLENNGLKVEFIHKIVLRSLFLLYLEDRGAAKKDFYSQIKKGAESYFDILDDVAATYKLFERLENHFNGNVFTLERDSNHQIIEKISIEQLQIIKKCFVSGNDNTPQTKLFEDWRLFNFDIIQIELLSEIYENFLAETDPTLKENSGTYYTPPSLVEFILNEKLPVNNNETQYNVKILDPSCGSGIFLVESFKRLVKRYEKAHNLKNLSDFNILVQILKENIFGIEIHPQAIKVAAFSLYLALVDKLDPKNLWQNANYKLPYLINDPEESDEQKRGKNLFCRDTISDLSHIEELQNFDLIVGNPPFGTKSLQNSIRTYCDEKGFAKEKVLPFLHKATLFAPKGEIALIFNTKVLTNTGGTYQNFRKWLFQECYIEKLYNFSILRKVPKTFGGQLFGDAVGPISIVFYQKEKPEIISDTIVYYAPKTYVKTNLVEGLNIDFTDVKFLPREECQKSDTKIWKITMWGGMNDWRLIKNLKKNKETFEKYLKRNSFEYGSGLHPKENEINKKYVEGKHIDTSKIKKYYTHKEVSSYIREEYRNNNFKIFKNPLTIIKEGVTNKGILSCFFDYDIYFNKAVYGFATSNVEKAKSISLLFNSDLAKYYFFLTSSSWGIERDRVVLAEYLEFPYLEMIEAGNITFEKTNFEENNLFSQTKHIFNKYLWENKILELYELSKNDAILIDDCIKFSVDLFYNQVKSVALKPVLKDQPKEYAQILTSELNKFLDEEGLFANATIYSSNDLKSSPLMMIKLTHNEQKKEIYVSNELIGKELKKIDQYLWEKKSKNIYFRKKLNYTIGNDIFIIRPNQRRFWSKSMAYEDASGLILEILNGVHDGND
ncbi:HsdM family class I SAM-dependent methyltransferase [Capnocytophaga canimorsus]|uniref:HsdM family class I SAM-dependent methyltransferase n=1 Tax=Capnocytophaga canimorsus TaxID=28188 RepID=UPI001BB33FA9|nr:N-6 DNA methylase [Capnocytophaga canimorsus]